MRRLQRMEHSFVEYVPDKLQPGKLYISIEYATSAHLCACGCGLEVSNPITPTDWSLTFDGETVSLSPSIGNSSFPCKSHYWISNDNVVWEAKMTPRLTALSRDRDKRAKGRYFSASPRDVDATEQFADSSKKTNESDARDPKRDTWISKLKKRIS